MLLVAQGFITLIGNVTFILKVLQVRDWFTYYGTRFNTVEINSSFYRLPQLASLKRWRDESHDAFSFSLKEPRTITHFGRFQNTSQELKEFYTLASTGLGKKLKNVLFQLPATMQFNEKVLELAVTQMSNEFNNVIEFRHPSWWQEKTYEVLKKHSITFCTVSFSQLPSWSKKIKQATMITAFCYY